MAIKTFEKYIIIINIKYYLNIQTLMTYDILKCLKGQHMKWTSKAALSQLIDGLTQTHILV